MRYRFIRLEWSKVSNMSNAINEAIKPDEVVVNVAATNDEVLILVRKVERHE
jgi:hypothetical protein